MAEHAGPALCEIDGVLAVGRCACGKAFCAMHGSVPHRMCFECAPKCTYEGCSNPTFEPVCAVCKGLFCSAHSVMSIDHYQVCTTCDAVIETARRENFAPNRVKRLEDELAATYADFRLAKASSAAELEDYTRVRRLGLERHVRVQPAVRGWRLGKMGWTATGREGEVVVDLLETFLATDGSFWSGVDVDTKHPSWRKRQVKEIAKPPKFVAYDLSGIHLEGLEEIIAKLKAMM